MDINDAIILVMELGLTGILIIRCIGARKVTKVDDEEQKVDL